MNPKGLSSKNTSQCKSESINSLFSFMSNIQPLPAQPRGQWICNNHTWSRK
jgi:hypothetical protein